jgi:outer membrane lipoprotein-sorting protein
MIKNKLLLGLVLVLAGSGVLSLSAQSAGSENILEEIDAQVSYLDQDFSAEYTVTQEKPGQGRSITRAAVFRRDREDKFVILILEPLVDKGKGYLKIGDTLWIYDPVSRRFNVTSAKNRFQNSNARNSDFTSSTLARDYHVVERSREPLGAYDTRVYELEALNDEVTFPFMKIWVDENNLVRKFEDYSLSRQLLRTVAIPTYQRVGERFVPVHIVMVDALQGRTVDGVFRNERTIIQVAKPTLGELPDLMFTQAYLERASR